MGERRSKGAGDGALLLGALRTPALLPELAPDAWDRLLRLARRARLLGRLHAVLSASGDLGRIPGRAANHLVAAGNLARHRQTLVTWELNRVLWALDGVDAPVIALKGAAYVLAGLPPAPGRLFADLDVLVPESRIRDVEGALLARGWYQKRLDPYDEHYYREWMHEIPPLRHRERETEVDIHHALLPRTSLLRADPARLIEAARPLPNKAVKVLAPPDMVLHALLHLLLEGDPQEGLRLRDLLDVHDLLGHFGRDEPGFWEALPRRARELGLMRILYYGLRHANRLLGTDIPDGVLRETASGAPSLPVRSLMDQLVPLAILPEVGRPGPRVAAARWLIYMRAHWLRMPPWLLARHLSYKAWLQMGARRGRARPAPRPQDPAKQRP